MKWFHSFDTMDWPRVAVVVAAATVFWGALQAIVPEKYWKFGVAILAGTTAAVGLIMRSGKSRVEKIDEKIEDFRTEGVKKRGEIKELISNAVTEKKAEQKKKK